MTIFWALFLKTTPLYFNIILGYIAGRFLHVQGDNIAKLMFYMFVPIVIFSGIAKTEINSSVLLLPFLVFSVCTAFCLVYRYIGGRVFGKDSSLKNILALTVGTANSGYFGLPVAMILFDYDSNIVGIYMTALVGMTLFESSVGFYVSANGVHTQRESFIRVLRLPTLYAFIAGAIFGVYDIELPVIVDTVVDNVKGCYVVLGMMIIGLGISKLDSCKMDYKFFSLALTAKFIMWPLVIYLIKIIDINMFNIFSDSAYKSLTLLSILPLAANSVAIATVLNTHPSKVATTVFASTLFAMLYVPLMVVFLFY